VTAALLCLAAGILAWPDPAALRRSRLGRVPRRLPAGLPLGPVGGPVLAAGATAAVAAAASTPLVAVLAACCAGLAARTWVGRRRSLREDARASAVTESLGVLAAELRSGRPPEVAAAAAARSGADEELGRALLRTVRASDSPTGGGARAGPVDEALDRLAAAVRLSARTGASLADVVTAVEDDLRARRRHRLELRSAVAAPRASASLLAGLPVLGLAMGSGIGADPWHVLTATGTGQVLLVAGVGLELAGVAWSRRLVARATRDAPAAGR
jgi:tight adherence protein B